MLMRKLASIPACTGRNPLPVTVPSVAPRLRQPTGAAPASSRVLQERLAPARAGPPAIVYAEGYKEVEELAGARIVVESDPPRVEYLVKWKDGSDPTWEVAADLSEDLVRDFEEKWWAAARKADVDAMISLLAGGRELLANVVDENRRSALHFAAALGSAECTKLLVEAGADLDLQDKEGYTPLHMAAGYMHTPSMAVLLEAGANPEIKDNTGRDVVSLIENLRASMPLSMGSVQRILALEEVKNCLTDRLYDEVEPGNVLNSRATPDGAGREFLVSFGDGRDDEWVPERNVSADVLEDYLAGLEYARAEEILDVVQVRTERRFKIRWSDGYPTSWEPEEHVPPELIELFAAQHPELFAQRTSAEAAARPDGWAQVEYETQASPVAGAGAAAAAAPAYGANGSSGANGSAANGSSGANGSSSGSGSSSSGSSGIGSSQREAVGAAR
ncbi:hypothetical protein HYH02_003290 [Chlamydomonas schloesseri]|uniref:Chromo domain-containing protein n=1 Tax=Chlamydomonas schloesseri TaxID=2026947 RepID=A0A835WT11_9CHLO|nr:hypothetical protein HYH02_003290 [Chlamydomonas schloesseri]|eukprot:KAG2452266.1 hypothetical protein HYH02_003290 [Chlamydomonas schloesseri]